MSGSLVFLPLRLGLRAVDLAVRSAADVLERLAGLAGAHVDHPPDPDAPNFSAAPPEPPVRAAPPPRPTQTQTAGTAAPVEPVVDRGDTIDYDTPTRPEPAHIEVEAVLVEEVAEPGAEDGAGAQVRFAEPWDGYRELRAADIIDRLTSASPEELAAIELYELSSRKRQTVIAAAQRELRRR